jgi:hypothetical protein
VLAVFNKVTARWNVDRRYVRMENFEMYLSSSRALLSNAFNFIVFFNELYQFFHQVRARKYQGEASFSCRRLNLPSFVLYRILNFESFGLCPCMSIICLVYSCKGLTPGSVVDYKVQVLGHWTSNFPISFQKKRVFPQIFLLGCELQAS